MALSLTHAFTSAIASGGDPSVVRPSDWNATHTLTGTANKGLGFDNTGAAAEVSFGAGLTLSSNSLGFATGISFDTTNQALTLTSIANPAASTLTLTGGTALTTSQPVLNMTQTWNASGVTFTGFLLNVTSTASASGSLLADFQVAGVSKVSIRKDGWLVASGTFGIGASSWYTPSGGQLMGSGTLQGVANSISISNVLQIGGNANLIGEAANTLAQRNGGSAQAHRWYETWTDASNNAYTEMALVSSVWTWRTIKNGTGTVREMAITPLTKLTINGSTVIGSAAIATNATDGFLYIPTCAGTPTGTPTTQTGTVAMVYDTTNNKMYVYNGAWKGGTAPGAWS